MTSGSALRIILLFLVGGDGEGEGSYLKHWYYCGWFKWIKLKAEHSTSRQNAHVDSGSSPVQLGDGIHQRMISFRSVCLTALLNFHLG